MPADRSSDERFHVLFAEHHRQIHAFCLRRLAIDDANDAAADVFTVAWRRIDDVPDSDEALHWLYGVARNVVRNHQRGAIRGRRLIAKAGSVAQESPDGPETQVIRHSENDEVMRALTHLRDRDQELLRLKTWEQLSNKSIASVLSISEQAVESRYARAIARLAKKLPAKTDRFGRSPLSNQKGEEAV